MLRNAVSDMPELAQSYRLNYCSFFSDLVTTLSAFTRGIHK